MRRQNHRCSGTARILLCLIMVFGMITAAGYGTAAGCPAAYGDCVPTWYDCVSYCADQLPDECASQCGTLPFYAEGFDNGQMWCDAGQHYCSCAGYCYD